MLLQEDTKINVSRQKQVVSTTVPLPYYLKLYSIKYELQALTSSWLLFWEIGAERPPSSVCSARVYTATIYLKMIMCSPAPLTPRNNMKTH